MDTVDLGKFTLKPYQSIRRALEVIDQNGREIALVENDQGVLVGVITDGDIRRGLLRGLSLETQASQIMTQSYMSVGPELDRPTILDVMKARSIRHMPVLDSQKRLIGIHFLTDLIGIIPKPNIAVIMAGGKGIRLRPLTENRPKPMMLVAGRPILERTIHHLVGSGIQKVYIAVNYLGQMIEDHFGDGSKLGCSINYLREDQPLGTGGALSLLPELPADPVLVMNGDLVTQVDISQMLGFHQSGKFEATIGVKPYQFAIPYGVIESKDGALLKIQEKPLQNFLVSAGIYVINPSALSLIPKDEEYPITTLFEQMLSLSHPVGVHMIDGDWLDIGMHQDLKRARGEF